MTGLLVGIGAVALVVVLAIGIISFTRGYGGGEGAPGEVDVDDGGPGEPIS